MFLAGPSDLRAHLSLIPGFSISIDGSCCEIGHAPSRLLAVLALSSGPLERSAVASILWPDLPESRAGANLRTGLWRVKQLDGDIIVSDGSRLRLGDNVSVDYSASQRLAHRVLGGGEIQSILLADGESRDHIQRLIHSFTSELLAGWYEEWLDVHQERWRQLRLHALDSLSNQLTEAGLLASAIDAATAAVAAEPLRESGYRSLVAAHLAEGNVGEAIRTHEQYRSVLERELGVSPSIQMYELLCQATGTASPNGHLEQASHQRQSASGSPAHGTLSPPNARRTPAGRVAGGSQRPDTATGQRGRSRR